MMDRTMVRLFLPLACAWARKREAIIIREGISLTESQMEDARRIGVKSPEKVRLGLVNEVPMPLILPLRRLVEGVRLVSADTVGMTLFYGIFIRSDCRHNRRLLVHELTHTAQYERMGGFVPFLREYLFECLNPGYPFGPLEQEAKRMELELCPSG
jgi:hypothetical protein